MAPGPEPPLLEETPTFSTRNVASTLGGIATFGLNGFVIGPVIAAMFIAAWDIFSASRESADNHSAIR
jgi:hypothetical protein